MTARSLILVALPLALSACGSDPTVLNGQVTDIWGASLTEATVRIESNGTSVTTDDQGYFSLTEPELPLSIRVGKDGYIQAESTLQAKEDGSYPAPVVALYPRPAEPGFYVVGQTSYTQLEPLPVQVIGNELSKVSGLRSISTTTGRNPFEVIFESPLRLEEVTRLNLQLHRLTYSATVQVEGPFGTEEADANLYTAATPVAVELSAMRSRDAYRIVPTETLEPGWYAFHIQNVLDPNQAADLASLPQAQKVAWAFEYKP